MSAGPPSCFTKMPEKSGFNFSPATSSHHLLGATNASWERRYLRKHRRQADDEGCCAKRRRLMEDGMRDCSLSEPVRPAAPQACPGPRDPVSSPQPAPETEPSCMEVEAAQRRLQEIEERITLEDDDDDEDLDVEPATRPPVLVMSDSLREGLQRASGDILPHKVAQSMNQSCMELVVWRPPEDALSRRLKDSLQRQQRKQHSASRQQTPHSSASTSLHSPLSSPSTSLHRPLGSPSTNLNSPLETPQTRDYAPPAFCSLGGTNSSGEEDMEL